jgi:5'-nucleotidase
VKTASGYAATAVEGKPADSVHVALDVLHLRPDLVVSGANLGQNVGPSTKRSGTVGAALTAARTGIPALAVSAASTAPDFAHAAELVVGWVNDHRRAILAGTEPAEVTSLNVPTCPGGPRGTVVEPTATALAGRRPDHVRCHSQADEGSFADDVDAFVHGYAVFAPVPK